MDDCNEASIGFKAIDICEMEYGINLNWVCM